MFRTTRYTVLFLGFFTFFAEADDHAVDAPQKLARVIDQSEKTEDTQRDELRKTLDRVVRTDVADLHEEELNALETFLDSDEVGQALDSEERADIEERIEKLRKRNAKKETKIDPLPWVSVGTTAPRAKETTAAKKEISTPSFTPQVKAFTDMIQNWVNENPPAKAEPLIRPSKRTPKSGLAVVQSKLELGGKTSPPAIPTPATPPKEEPALPAGAPDAPTAITAPTTTVLLPITPTFIKTKDEFAFTAPADDEDSDFSDQGRPYAADASIVLMEPEAEESVEVNPPISNDETPGPPPLIKPRRQEGPLKLTWLENELKPAPKNETIARVVSEAAATLESESRSPTLAKPAPPPSATPKSAPVSELEKMLQFAGAPSAGR